MNYGQTHNGALDFNDGANADCEYQYDSGGDCEYQYDSNGALTRDCNRGINSITHHFYYLGNGIIVMKEGSAVTPLVAVADHLGSITHLMKGDGTTMFAASYDAWGRQTVTTNTIGFHRGYCGHEMLPEYVLVNMRSAFGRLLPKGRKNYYPFGTPYSNATGASNPDLQPYKYNGKELLSGQITSLSGLLKKVRRLRTLCPKASDALSEGFGLFVRRLRTKIRNEKKNSGPSYFAFHSVMLRSFDEKARPTFVTGRPSRVYLAE